MPLSRILAAFLLACPLLASPLLGQAPDTATISVSAKLVVVPAVVRDKHGALIGDLNRDNFVLRVDGKPQPLRYFDHDADVPLTLGLLVDTSMSQTSLLDDERTASAAFLDKMLSPADKAFILSFDIAVRRLADVTASRPALDQALKQVDSPHPDFTGVRAGLRDGGRLGMMNPAVRDAMRAVIGTRLFDAVYFSAASVTAEQKGRRALVLLTDGGDHGSSRTLDDAIEAAQRADTIVYAIYYVAAPGATADFLRNQYGRGATRSGAAAEPRGEVVVPASSGARSNAGIGGKKVLEELCGATGGKMFEVSGKQTVADIYAKIAAELRAQYRLGFSPASAEAAAGYHRVELSLTGAQAKGRHSVQTRDGYFSDAPPR